MKHPGTSVLLAALMAVTHQGHAGGFYLSTVATPGSLGTAGAGNTTNNHGADSAWTNPAGMTALDEDLTVTSGMTLIVPLVTFDASIATAGGKDGNNAGLFAPVPSTFAVKKLSERLRFGFSIVAPLGGGVDYGNGFVGRYSVNKATLSGIAASPSFGFKVNERLSLGAGASLVYSVLDEEISVRQPGQPDGEVSIDQIDDIGLQGFVGVTYQASDRLLLGAVYRSKLDVNLEGDVTIRSSFVPFTSLDDIKVKWDNPQLLEVGLRYRIDDSLSVVANADWEDWSVFSNNQLSVSKGRVKTVKTIDRNWKDTWHVGLGLVKNLGDHVYSMGVSYDSSPVDDGDRTLDLPVDEQFKISAAMARTGTGSFDYALGATLMNGGDAALDQTSQGVRVRGEFDNNWILFLGGTLRFQF
jgi:long-chain fatty acid transport protein